MVVKRTFHLPASRSRCSVGSGRGFSASSCSITCLISASWAAWHMKRSVVSVWLEHCLEQWYIVFCMCFGEACKAWIWGRRGCCFVICCRSYNFAFQAASKREFCTCNPKSPHVFTLVSRDFNLSLWVRPCLLQCISASSTYTVSISWIFQTTICQPQCKTWSVKREYEWLFCTKSNLPLVLPKTVMINCLHPDSLLASLKAGLETIILYYDKRTRLYTNAAALLHCPHLLLEISFRGDG